MYTGVTAAKYEAVQKRLVSQNEEHRKFQEQHQHCITAEQLKTMEQSHKTELQSQKDEVARLKDELTGLQKEYQDAAERYALGKVRLEKVNEENRNQLEEGNKARIELEGKAGSWLRELAKIDQFLSSKCFRCLPSFLS